MLGGTTPSTSQCPFINSPSFSFIDHTPLEFPASFSKVGLSQALPPYLPGTRLEAMKRNHRGEKDSLHGSRWIISVHSFREKTWKGLGCLGKQLSKCTLLRSWLPRVTSCRRLHDLKVSYSTHLKGGCSIHCLCCWTASFISVMDNSSWFTESLESLKDHLSSQISMPRIKPGEYPNLLPWDRSLHDEHHKSPNIDNTQLLCFRFCNQ